MTYPYRSSLEETKQSTSKTSGGEQATEPPSRALGTSVKPSFSAVNLEDPFIEKKTGHSKDMRNARTVQFEDNLEAEQTPGTPSNSQIEKKTKSPILGSPESIEDGDNAEVEETSSEDLPPEKSPALGIVRLFRDLGLINIDTSSDIPSSLYCEARDNLYRAEEYPKSKYRDGKYFDLSDEDFTPNKIRDRCIQLGITTREDFDCWEANGVFQIIPFKGKPAEGMLRYAITKAKAALYYKKEGKGLMGLKNLSRSILQKVVT
ncbi:hypothetical protein DTO271D3_3571 [Paecilomyces variotii]|nr:hypothetical protein DTO271D3_3571 [Paecilomyces variotii]